MVRRTREDAGNGDRGAGGATSSHRDDRLRAIVRAIEAAERPLSVEDLARSVGASQATIRRDVAVLEGHGMLSRSWGRVGRLGSFIEQPIAKREAQRAQEKRRIAEAAASLVSDGTTVGLTGGTTTRAVARALAGRERLTVVTNSLSVGVELAPRRNIRLVMSGGVARTASFELSGPLAASTLTQFNLDLAIIGVDGLDVRAGCTTYDDTEAATNAAMIGQAARTIVVADATKLAKAAFARMCELSEVSLLITDASASPAVVADIERHGVPVTQV